MKTSTAPVLIDVRLEEDYLAAHLPEAKNNCVYEVSFSERMSDVAPTEGGCCLCLWRGSDSYEARMAAEKLSAPATGRSWKCARASTAGNRLAWR